MDLFPGPLALYLSEGFTVVEPGDKRSRVRRALAWGRSSSPG
jgi:hypothetical protein